MDTFNKGDFVKKVEQEIEATKTSIEKLKQQTNPVSPDNSIGRLSRMEAINAKSVTETSIAQANERLKKLAWALSQADNEDFPYCQNCGEAIPLKRLMLVPESRRCVECAQI